MRVRSVLASVFLFAISVVSALSVMAQPEEDVLELKSSIIEEHARPIVQFSHYAHLDDYGIACNECHHVFKDGENVWEDDDPVQKCQECHTDPTTKNELRLPAKKLNLKYAFHKNCIGCHRSYNKENNIEAAPVTCQSCHVESK
jgi:hypothetical protein